MNSLPPEFLKLSVEELLAQLCIGIVVVNKDGAECWANPASQDLLAIVSNHVPDAPADRLLTSFPVPTSAAALAQRKERENASSELTVLRLDRVPANMKVLPSPVFDNTRQFLGSLTVILARPEEIRPTEARDKALVEIIRALTKTIEERNAYSSVHQQRVANLSIEIGRRLQLDDERLEGLYLAALVHDVGKIAIPLQFLNKPGPLNEAELGVVRSHAEVGQDILKAVTFPWPIAAIVGQHHERFDGSGYPLGLKGNQIIKEAQIIAVADALDAMLEHRPYRPALKFEAALARLAGLRGSQFDAAIVDACLSIAQEHSNDADQMWSALECRTVVAGLGPK